MVKLYLKETEFGQSLFLFVQMIIEYRLSLTSEAIYITSYPMAKIYKMFLHFVYNGTEQLHFCPILK
jgi:hypothetical protein